MFKKTTIVTHNGEFHTDDVFAVAALQMYLKTKGKSSKVFRTRDLEKMKDADYVVDLGREFNSEENRFDHHQKGGAGKRDNGVPYASFGLIWEKFGEELCGSKSVAEKIDKVMVQSIDGYDNGVMMEEPVFKGITTYSIGFIVKSFLPTWKEGDGDKDKRFNKAVKFAKKVLKREIKVAQDWSEAEEVIKGRYNSSEDKNIIILNKEDDFGRVITASTLQQFTEPIYAVFYGSSNDMWKVIAVSNEGTFESRKQLPKEWWGLADEKLADVCGVQDALFCHQTGFYAGAKSKEGAMKMAEIAFSN